MYCCVAMCVQALRQLAYWRGQHKLHIVALSCDPVNLPFELEVLGQKDRYSQLHANRPAAYQGS